MRRFCRPLCGLTSRGRGARPEGRAYNLSPASPALANHSNRPMTYKPYRSYETYRPYERPKKCVERTCKPNSVPPRPCGFGGENHSSAARIAAAVEQPTRTLERIRADPLRPYLVLLRRGFAVPSTLTCDAVRSYRTVSPLPPMLACARTGSAVCFLLHFPSRHRAWPLASLLPVGVRTFLDGFPPRSSGPLHARHDNRGPVHEILCVK